MEKYSKKTRSTKKEQIRVLEDARDFTLLDTSGSQVRLSDYFGKKTVVLVFNRGFAWPYCRAHLAQLCQDYSSFIEAGAEILAIGPDGPNAFKRFWENEHLPFPGLSDIGNKIAKLYYQEINLLKFGWVPAMFIVDLVGKIRYVHYGDNMQDIPRNQDVLAILTKIRKDNY